MMVILLPLAVWCEPSPEVNQYQPSRLNCHSARWARGPCHGMRALYYFCVLTSHIIDNTSYCEQIGIKLLSKCWTVISSCQTLDSGNKISWGQYDYRYLIMLQVRCLELGGRAVVPAHDNVGVLIDSCVLVRRNVLFITCHPRLSNLPAGLRVHAQLPSKAVV